MSKPIILKALPIVLLSVLCLILGGIIIAQSLDDGYLPAMAEVEDRTAEDVLHE